MPSSTNAFDHLPPSEADPLDLIRLHLATLYHAGLGRTLLDRHGSAQAVLRLPPDALREVPGMKESVIEKLVCRSISSFAREEVRRARNLGVSILSWGAQSYPTALAELSAMPVLLYARGSLQGTALPQDAVGVVGSRKPTPYGIAQAQRFACSLAARGISVVSGLALGIDGEAHRAALDAGGSTVAVLGSGLGRIYPGAHCQLAERIVSSARGMLLSEFPLLAAPKSFHFPMRNRILSGLSRAVLVIEAGEKSGSLITVAHALEQGKTVYVLPGRVDRPESLGCLRLLMDGASPVITPQDVLPGLGRSEAPGMPGGSDSAPERLPGKFGARLSELFASEDTWQADELAGRLEAPAHEVLRELSRLELDGFLRRLPGGAYQPVEQVRAGRSNMEVDTRQT